MLTYDLAQVRSHDFSGHSNWKLFLAFCFYWLGYETAMDGWRSAALLFSLQGIPAERFSCLLPQCLRPYLSTELCAYATGRPENKSENDRHHWNPFFIQRTSFQVNDSFATSNNCYKRVLFCSNLQNVWCWWATIRTQKMDTLFRRCHSHNLLCGIIRLRRISDWSHFF